MYITSCLLCVIQGPVKSKGKAVSLLPFVPLFLLNTHHKKSSDTKTQDEITGVTQTLLFMPSMS